MNTVVEALIEIPLHSKNKYEIDPTTGKIKLDRVLYASMVYPTEYGSVENTLAPDGDRWIFWLYVIIRPFRGVMCRREFSDILK